MSNSRSLTKSKAEFIAYYSKLFPNLDIESFLSRKNAPVLLFSPEHVSELRQMFSKAKLSWIPYGKFPNSIERPPEIPVSNSLPGFKEGWLYSLNFSSLLPVLALNPEANDSILDASAAPGGKTLAILNFTYPKAPVLTANDISSLRFKHLIIVLKRFGRSEVSVIHHPIQSLPKVLKHQFDKILLDAPCSGEKHIFNSKHFLKIWAPDSIAKMAKLQKTLITSLLPLLKPRGLLVYSTCALSYEENENQITSLLKDHPELRLERPTQRFNDPNSNYDPMFVAVITTRY